MDVKVKINGSVLLKKNPLAHRNWYHLYLATDGLDRSGLQLEKNGQFFQVLPVYFEKLILVYNLPYKKSPNIFLLVL